MVNWTLLWPNGQQKNYPAAGRVEINPKIMMEKPIIKGPRNTIEQVLESLSENTSIDNVLKAHPHLTQDQIQAALSFACNC